MINLYIKKNDDGLKKIPLIFNFYDNINRVPLEIIFDEASKYRQGINIDNYNEETGTFITFKFDRETNILCSITFVSINEENIFYKEFTKNINYIGDEYQFYVNEFSVRTNYETKLLFDSNSRSILFCFDNIKLSELNFYSADKNLLLGIDLNNNLKSICLRDLEEDNIKRFLNL
ncbi:hypothetical protein [Chryseobacterium hispalense]|uniref:hypothetical protein n=1 Tax=Chryseobacterium hispalense TaxID=1453492 RepID=UPI0004937F39|nr:hypothetical protein [Chryseobacterium hispalense]